LQPWATAAPGGRAICRGGKKRKADGDGRDGGNMGQREPYKELGICWAHYHFGKKARDCRPPCLFSGN
jgi:hypothetical protein